MNGAYESAIVVFFSLRFGLDQENIKARVGPHRLGE